MISNETNPCEIEAEYSKETDVQVNKISMSIYTYVQHTDLIT